MDIIFTILAKTGIAIEMGKFKISKEIDVPKKSPLN
jgi:hypothetical protein